MKPEISFFYYHAARMNLATQLADALRAMPDDFGMIEHNPDEGMRLFCCGGDIIHNWHGDDIVKHAAECWYIAAREALAAYDAQRARSSIPAGDHTAEPWQALGEFIGTCENDYQTIAYTSDHRNRKTRPAAQREADARRIVACVNACAGIPTNELEGAHFAGAAK